MASVFIGSLAGLLSLLAIIPLPDLSSGRQVGNKHDYLVSTAAELLDAARKAGKGEVIYVNDKAEIDMTKQGTIVLAAGVTLKSGRGTKNSKGQVMQGGLIFSKDQGQRPLIKIIGESVRISDIRIIGPDTLQRVEEMKPLKAAGKFYSVPYCQGIVSDAPNTVIDNVELCGWSHAAILLNKNAINAQVLNSYIHHNQRWGLGYGVCLSGGTALIKGNTFNYNRHSISGSGVIGEQYEASFNMVLQHGLAEAFDMHGGSDRKDGTDIAGTLVNIHDNTFYYSEIFKDIIVNGRPTQGLIVRNNKFLKPNQTKAVRHGLNADNAVIENNTYGIPNKIIEVNLDSYRSMKSNNVSSNMLNSN